MKVRKQAVEEILGDLSRTDLAKRAKLDRSHITRILNGERVPNVEAFRSIAVALGISMDNLFAKLYAKK